jgi:hypothetical protein
MFILFAYSFFTKEMSSRFILRLHLTFSSILKFIDFIFECFIILLNFIVKNNVFFKFIFVIDKKRMLNYVRKCHSFFAINNENSFEEIL